MKYFFKFEIFILSQIFTYFNYANLFEFISFV